jgi:hypothetical protein
MALYYLLLQVPWKTIEVQRITFANMKLGLTTFVERTTDPLSGSTLSALERMRNLLEEIELAEQVGFVTLLDSPFSYPLHS